MNAYMPIRIDPPTAQTVFLADYNPIQQLLMPLRAECMTRANTLTVTGWINSENTHIVGTPDDPNITSALSDLRGLIRERLSDRLVGFSLDRIEGGEDEGEVIKHICLTASIRNVPREERRKLISELLTKISESPSHEVRKIVTISFR